MATDDPGPSDQEAIDEYGVVCLGGPGAGKTTLQAAVYANLNMERPSRTYFLRTGPRDIDIDRYLTDLWQRIANPGLDWPPSTAYGTVLDINWSFVVRKNEQTDYDVFRLRFTDYDGRRLVPQAEAAARGDELDEALESRLRDASAYWKLLDGTLLLRTLQGDPTAAERLSRDIHVSLRLFSRYPRPVCFVVTKWDLLEHHVDLGKIHRLLLDQEDMSDFLEVRRERGGVTVRLIPVSVVGPEFIARDAAGEVVGKRHDRRPRPVNVELPVLATVTDFLEATRLGIRKNQEEGREITAQAEAAANREIGRIQLYEKLLEALPTRELTQLLARPVVRPGDPAERLHSIADAVKLARAYAGSLVERRLEERRQAHAQLHRELRQALTTLENRQEAVELALMDFSTQIEEFAAANPASLLLRAEESGTNDGGGSWPDDTTRIR